MKSQTQPTTVCFCGESSKLRNSRQESRVWCSSFRGGGEGNANSFLDSCETNRTANPSLRFQKAGKQTANKVKLLEKYNVFINSYYPTVLNNPSDGHVTKKSHKSTNCKSRNYEIEKYECKNSTSNESTKAYNRNVKNSYERKKFELPKSLQNCCSSEDDNKTCITSDSKTYTVVSQTSATYETENGIVNENVNTKYVERMGKYIVEDCDVEETEGLQHCHYTDDQVNRDRSDNVNCEFFSRLYERIEVLEKLLLKTIERTPVQEKHHKTKVSRKHQQTSTSKLTEVKPKVTQAPIIKKNVQNKGKPVPNFDGELDNIKKRLRVLEKKLNDGKKARHLRNAASINDISMFTEELLRDAILESERLESYKGSDHNLSVSSCLTNDSFSATAVFSRIKQECAEYLNSRKKLNPKKNEEKKPFVSRCKKLKNKCSNILNQKKPEVKSSPNEHKSHKKVTPRKSADPSSTGRNDLKKDDSLTKVMFVNKRMGDKHTQADMVKKPVKKKTKPKIKMSKTSNRKQSKTNFSSHRKLAKNKVQAEQPLRELSCSSISSGNSVPNDTEQVATETKTLSKCVEVNEEALEPCPTEGQQAWTMLPKYNNGYWPPYPFWLPFPPPNPESCFYHGFPCSITHTPNIKNVLQHQPQPQPQPQPSEEKHPEGQINIPDPVKILKSGGEIKIPVLFEQVNKKKKKDAVRKTSDISMRFMVVDEEDRNPLAPLRKLIKKLSKIQNKRTEHYVFGMSKCCCDDQSERSWRTMSEDTGRKWMLPDAKAFLPEITVLNAVVLTLAVVLSYRYWRKRNFYRLAAMIDGPKGLPLIGNAMEYLALDHVKILDYLMEITTKYNGLAKVWLGEILLVHISRPEDMEILLSSNKLIEKNVMYKFFDDVLGQGLLNARGDIWRKHRKIIAPTFHPAILKHFVKIFSEQSKILVKVLEKNADGKIFNVFPYVRNCALDFITETALENHIGAQLRVVAPATRAAERLMNITYNRMFKLWLYSDFIFYRTQQGKEYLRLRDLVKESTEPLLEVKKKEVAEKDPNRNTEGVKRKSFFRALVELNENNENFNDKELRDEVVTMIITGYETTAATIGFVLVMLGIHQDIQAKVYEEVVAMQEQLKGRELEAEDLTRFEYMDRVIKETLRLYPVGPIIFRECTHDVKLTTCTIPKGASVAVVILKTHRDPSIWENPEEFNPDNFLPEKCEKRHPYAYIPFSAGPRNCIGKQYAYLSMRVMLYHILSKYKILCDLRDEDIKMKSEVTMKMVGGFKIRMLPRTSSTTQS